MEGYYNGMTNYDMYQAYMRYGYMTHADPYYNQGTVGLGNPNPSYKLNIEETLTTNNTMSNQEQTVQTDNAIKYLQDKRDKASEVVEINIKEYNKIIQENADLKAKSKASEDVIRIEQVDNYDEETIVTYSGKDKAIVDLSKNVNSKEREIRDLQQQLEISNKHIAEIVASKQKSINKEEKRLQEHYEQKFEKDNAKLIKTHKNEIKDLNNVIDELNDKIQEANDRNKILADMNNRYKDTLNKLMRYLSDKAFKFFTRKFKLNALLQSNNEYRVSIPYQGSRDLYINTVTGASYWA